MVLDEQASWTIELWRMDQADEPAAIACNEALLLGGSTDAVAEVLASDGIDLDSLLMASDDAKEDITRSDMTELVAVSSLVATEWCSTDDMHMPNVPKMARKKSDSGVDIFAVAVDDGRSGMRSRPASDSSSPASSTRST